MEEDPPVDQFSILPNKLVQHIISFCETESRQKLLFLSKKLYVNINEFEILQDKKRHLEFYQSIFNFKQTVYSCGAYHTFVQDNNGVIWCWGLGANGRLGLHDRDNRYQPAKLEDFPKGEIMQISAGTYHSMAVNTKGEVYAWGDGGDGQLGHNNRMYFLFPKIIDALKKHHIVQVCAAGHHSLALDKDQKVYSWGSRQSGVLGYPNKRDQLIPREIESLSDKKVCKIYAAGPSNYALTQEGAVYVWGDNGNGQLANVKKAILTQPQKIEGLPSSPIIEMACSGLHVLALTQNNRIFVWGNNHHGQLGLGYNTQASHPKELKIFRDQTIIDIAVGDYHSLLLTEDGKVYSWGMNTNGQLGLGHQIEQHSPVEIKSLADQKIVRLFAGREHSMAITASGQIYAWGKNSRGQCGIDHIQQTNHPMQIDSFTLLDRPLTIQMKEKVDKDEVFISELNAVKLKGIGRIHP